MLYPEKERIQFHPAFILHHRPYRNTSLLLDVLTENHGRISLIAKGAKRAKSQFRGCLQPFQSLSLSWVKKTQLGTLTGAELSEKPLPLFGEVMYAGLYLNELLTRILVNDDPVNDIYCAYARALKQLSVSSGIAPILREFEYTLLQSLGFEIQLDHDVEQKPILPNVNYKFIPEQGFIASTEKNAYLFQGDHLIRFRHKQFDSPEVLKISQQLMKSGLHQLIGDKPLKSRELFKAYRQISKNGNKHGNKNNREK